MDVVVLYIPIILDEYDFEVSKRIEKTELMARKYQRILEKKNFGTPFFLKIIFFHLTNFLRMDSSDYSNF